MKFVLLTLCLALPVQALARDLPQWRDVINNDKYVKTPSAAQIQKFASHAVPKAAGPQIFTVGERFVFLFDEDGQAVVTFDLTMDQIGIGDMVMGAIGIGHWSIEGIFKLFRDMRDKPMDLIDGEKNGITNFAALQGLKNVSDWNVINPNDLVKPDKSEIKNGYKVFSKLEFNDAWIAKNKANKVESGERSGFKPASFNMADLYLPADKRAEAEKMWNQVSLVLFKATLAEMGGLEEFTKQFGMKWDGKTEQFKMVWSPSKAAKRPEIPGWVVNYVNPTDLLAYKLSLRQIEQYTGFADTIFGVYGAIGATLVTRVVNSITSQIDSHENQLLTFLEGAAAGVYDLGMPLQDASGFIDGTSLLIYLGKLDGGDDITNAEMKRKNILKAEANARSQNLEWLEKHGFEAKLWADQRTATIYKNGKRLGVASVAIDRMWLTKWQSWHHYDAVPLAKSAGRLGLELFVDAVRYILPSAFDLSQFLPINISISIYIPGMFWDGLFRGRAYTEIAYEGHVLSQVNAAMAGKWSVPGYSEKDLAKLRFWLYAQRMNPFETTTGHEPTTIKRNTRLIDEFLYGGAGKEVFQLRDARLDLL